jgi:hypothetical protein
MGASKRIGDFKYSVMVLEADETSARYAEQRAEALQDERNWYAVWKCAERQHAYADIANQQREQIHTGLSGLMGHSVCSCAVMTEGSTGKTSDWRSEWMYTPGHINHTDGSLVTSFRVKLRNDETRTWSVFYFCQICDHIEPAATTDSASNLAAFQKLHFHEKGEN